MKMNLQNINKAFAGLSTDRLYVGAIPTKILDNAIKGMRITVPRDQILAIYDSRLWFGHGSDGFAIVPEGIYFRNKIDDPHYRTWDEVSCVTHPEGSIYAYFDGFECFLQPEDIDNMTKGLNYLLAIVHGG